MEDALDTRELVHRFNEEEAVWRRFIKKLVLRRLRKPPLAEKALDQIDWLAAESECRDVRAIGRVVQ